jgi:pyruvate/2-oxoglutarate dehydrogenase complex dihydrolipoamide dehydrogenase (E3) component
MRDGSESITAGSHLLVSSARTPNTQEIGLELAGVAVDDNGYV